MQNSEGEQPGIPTQVLANAVEQPSTTVSRRRWREVGKGWPQHGTPLRRHQRGSPTKGHVKLLGSPLHGQAGGTGWPCLGLGGCSSSIDILSTLGASNPHYATGNKARHTGKNLVSDCPCIMRNLCQKLCGPAHLLEDRNQQLLSCSHNHCPNINAW